MPLVVRGTTQKGLSIKFWFFWSVQVVAMGLLAYVGSILIPEGAGKYISYAYPAVGAVIGAIVGFAIIFIINLLLAPYRQRNEARMALMAIPGATPNAPKLPHPPELHITYLKHKLGVDNGVPIITVWAEYRPTGTMRVEAVELCLVGKRISSLDWKVYEVKQDLWITSDNKFNLLAGISPGEHDAELFALANGDWWRSQPFPITLPEVSS